LQGRLSTTARTVAARLLHTPPPMKVTKPLDRECVPLLCLPTPAVTCKTTKNTRGVDFNFCFFVFNLFFSVLDKSVLFFSQSSLFQVAAGPRGRW
jgi:hypothetical protein